MDSQFDNEEEHSRYAGQLSVSGFSAVHQQKLLQAKVLLDGKRFGGVCCGSWFSCLGSWCS
jgi:molybdopterin/thiamine biosynthesis adenylyltransferase